MLDSEGAALHEESQPLRDIPKHTKRRYSGSAPVFQSDSQATSSDDEDDDEFLPGDEGSSESDSDNDKDNIAFLYRRPVAAGQNSPVPL